MENKKKISKSLIISLCLLLATLFAFVPIFTTTGIHVDASTNLIDSTNIQYNENLLSNGDFKLNSNGESSYNVNLSETVDNWFLFYGNLTVNSDGTVTHTSINTWQGIRQIISNPSVLAGKTVTLSAKAYSTDTRFIQLSLLKNGQTATTLGYSSVSNNGEEILSFTVTLPNDITNNDILYVILYTPSLGQSVTYHWVKLELGDTATPLNPPSYNADNLTWIPSHLPYTIDCMFYAFNLWTDGFDVYYSYGSYQYVLDLETLQFTPVTFNGLSSFYGSNIWTDGYDIFYSDHVNLGGTNNHYIYDRSTMSWTPITMTFYDSSYHTIDDFTFDKNYLWNNGDYVIYTFNSINYYFDKSNYSWYPFLVGNLSYGSSVFVIDGSIYSYYDNYLTVYSDAYNNFRSTGVSLNISNFDTYYLWSDGTDTYHSNYDTGTHYVFNKTTLQWDPITSNINFSGYDTFTIDGLVIGNTHILPVTYYDNGYSNGYDLGYDNGYDDGFDTAENVNYDDGYADGYDKGNSDGYDNGYSTGYDTGLSQGNSTGYDNGYLVGYNNGYNEGINDSNTYTFNNLFGAVLDAPVKVFSSLLNFNFLGVNLLSFITGLFTLAVIILIVKLALGGK